MTTTSFVKVTDIDITGAHTLPGRYFTSPELFAEEREKIFARRWICVGREAQIARPGDYVLADVAGEELIVLRDRAGVARAFYNVCRHRGTRLCEAAAGRFADTIQCPYHAWTYGLDGRLLGAPSTRDLAGFRTEDYPLHPVALAAWEGFLFVNLAADPEPFEQSFAPLLGRFQRFNLPSLAMGKRIVYEVEANWKLLVENYSECYHCSKVHPTLSKLTPPTSGENDLVDGPFLGGYMELHEGKDSMTMSGRSCGAPVAELPAEDFHRVYYYSLFPGMLLSLHPDYAMFHTLWPRDPGHTRIVCEWLFHPSSLTDPAYDIEDGVAFWDMTNRQDWHICEESQRGVSSRKYTPGPYSRRESLPARFDREVLKALGHAPHDAAR